MLVSAVINVVVVSENVAVLVTMSSVDALAVAVRVIVVRDGVLVVDDCTASVDTFVLVFVTGMGEHPG